MGRPRRGLEAMAMGRCRTGRTTSSCGGEGNVGELGNNIP